MTYEEALDAYLPYVPQPPGLWRYSADPSLVALPDQGWKVHISATVQGAAAMLSLAGDVLRRRGLFFKAVSSLRMLAYLNAGIYFGYTQVGKFVTIYPSTEAEFVAAVGELCARLPDAPCPAVPFDSRVREDRPVFYRYGLFGQPDAALVDPDGGLHPDERAADHHHPPWVSDPITRHTQLEGTRPRSSSVAAFSALSQRGKGGVYQALDFSTTPARLCVLKEGRRHGEASADGRDGRDMIEAEQAALREFAHLPVRVARLEHTYVDCDNAYSVLEYVHGRSLKQVLSTGFRRDAAMRYATSVAMEVHALHSHGWMWRDCKPTNILVEEDGSICLIDFEGACQARRPDPWSYGTPGYMAPMPKGHCPSLADDVYSLGAVLLHVFDGTSAWWRTGTPRDRDGMNVPGRIGRLVRAMLATSPADRPTSGEVVTRLLNDY